MPNIASMLKEEIVRLARKELKRELVTLRKQVTAHRGALAALKKQLADVERQAKQTARGAKGKPAATPTASTGRFSAKGLKTLRAKFGLSAADFGRLAGVTGTTVFNWEVEKARPQRAQLETLQGLRGLGKRAAWAKLEELAG